MSTGLPIVPAAIESLRCLFVQQNCLTEISHLEGCPNLDTLNVANNRITYISNLGNLTALNSLHAAHNFVATKEDMKGLLECPSLGCVLSFLPPMRLPTPTEPTLFLSRGAAGDAHHHGPLSAFHPVRSVVDLSHNKIEDPECLEILKQMPNLRCIYLQGDTHAYRHSRPGPAAFARGRFLLFRVRCDSAFLPFEATTFRHEGFAHLTYAPFSGAYVAAGSIARTIW